MLLRTAIPCTLGISVILMSLSDFEDSNTKYRSMSKPPGMSFILVSLCVWRTVVPGTPSMSVILSDVSMVWRTAAPSIPGMSYPDISVVWRTTV